jgi:hypothetical protein
MKIQFLGPVQAPPPEVIQRVEAEFQGGRTRDLLAALGFAPDQVWFLSVLAGEERLEPDDPVPPGAAITIMLIVGGG